MFHPERPPQAPSTIKSEIKENLLLPERVETAESALHNFLNLKPEEKVLFFRDGKTKPETLAILKMAIEKIGSSMEEIELSSKTKKRELNKSAKDAVIIDLAPDSEEISEGVYDNLEKLNSRLLCLFDLGPDAFEKGGAMSVNPEDLQYRLNKMEEVLKQASGFRVSSVYGTNLEIPLRRFKERKWYKDSGAITESGVWDNLPGGEIFTTPDERRVNGILVLPVLESTIVPEQGVDEFVHLNIKDGLITSIQGGQSAEKLRKQLEESALAEQKKGRNPANVYRIAEIAFGANSKARSTVADPEQPYNFPAVSVIEAEKRFGTMHLAFGSSQHGEEGTEGFEDCFSHYDFVLPRNGLTVEMFRNEDDFKKENNGRKIINEGNVNFG